MLKITENISKILAQENITIVQQAVETAFFNLETRTLVLPAWLGMEPEVEKMLAFHEVAHALFTPRQYIKIIEDTPELSDILGVIEDPRVERLFKERYPGSRRDFIAGYEALRQKDFFNIKNTDITKLNFIDRMNIFFKVGLKSGVKFSKEEVPFVERAQKIISFQEALQLAEDILKFLKQKALKAQKYQKQIENPEKQITENSGNSSERRGSGNSEVDQQGNKNTEKQTQLKELTSSNNHEDDNSLNALIRSTTKRAVEENLKSMVTQSEIKNVTPIYRYSLNYIVPYQKLLQKLEAADWNRDRENFETISNNIIRRKKRDVNHMISLFQIRKAANEFSAAQYSKTGLLDPERISLYKISKNIFKKRIEIPSGKNHGFVFLLDFSGSMLGDKIRDSLLQVITMAMFCQKVQVPYRIFAFLQRESNANLNLSLLELFSSEMKVVDFNKMLKYCCFGSKPFQFAGYFLGNTPLNESLLFMADYLLDFKEKYKLQKLNFTVFTDGRATDQVFYFNHQDFYNLIDLKKIFVYTDPKSKKNYYFTQIGYKSLITETTNILFQVIKDRIPSATINSYFLGSYNEGCNAMGFKHNEKDEREFAKKGFVALKGNGRDVAYFVSPRILHVEDDDIELHLNPEVSAAKIANELKRLAKSSNKEKLLLQHFVETIS